MFREASVASQTRMERSHNWRPVAAATGLSFINREGLESALALTGKERAAREEEDAMERSGVEVIQLENGKNQMQSVRLKGASWRWRVRLSSLHSR